MTFAEAEKEKTYRSKHLALLSLGDIVGLESYVCDLPTHMNSARCTAPCDLFYILKHNFVRLQKRHGTQGLAGRLREMVRLSFQAYPAPVIQLPLYQSLLKRQLAPIITDEQYQNKQSWLLHIQSAKPSVRYSFCFFFFDEVEYLASASIREQSSLSIGEEPRNVILSHPVIASDIKDQCSCSSIHEQRSRSCQ